MTSPATSRLLISHITLRGPELRQLYDLVAASPGISYADLVAALVPPTSSSAEPGLAEAPLREALNFLLVARLVEQVGPSRRRASFHAIPLLAHAPFALLLLHHISSHPEERQRAPVLIHRELTLDDALAISAQEVRDHMERGPLRGLFAWTSEKVSFWAHLLSALGLIRRPQREDVLLIVPTPSLLEAALRWACGDGAGPHALDACLQRLDSSLFACYTRRGRVHRGLAQSLVALHRLDRIKLAHRADAARSLLLGEWRVSEVALRPLAEVSG